VIIGKQYNREEISMGIFTRFRDIVSANINSMLDRAEDPEKMIRLMIREMEDTLVEIKSSCAGVMANNKRVQRQLNEVRTREKSWNEKATLAVNKGRDDLAREALVEKRKYSRNADALEDELIELNGIVDQYKADICQLEEKLNAAREKQRVLVQRHIHARKKIRAEEEIRRMDSEEAVLRFNRFENRIERLESEAEVVNLGRKPTLDEKFDHLMDDEEIENELAALKSREQTEERDVSAK
jgi:phage shock protein A